MMKPIRQLTLIVVLLAVSVSNAQMAKGVVTVDAAGLRVIDLTDDLTDISFLDSISVGVRVFFLGEAVHGDGKTIRSKARILKYLIEKLDFEVVIFELPFYEMEKANGFLDNRKVNANYVLMEAFRQQNFIGKSYVEDVIPVIVRNRNRVDLAGLEISSYSWYKNLLREDLMRYGISKGVANNYHKQLNELNFMVHCAIINECKEAEANFDFDSFRRISSTLLAHLNKKLAKYEKSDLESVIQSVRSNVGLIDWLQNGPGVEALHNDQGSRLNDVHVLRDKQMADNLLWILTKKHPNKKVVVWSSTYHMTRGLFPNLVMVDYLPDSIARQSYFLPFVSYQGKHGYENIYKVTQFKRDSGSLEYALHGRGISLGFIDFKSHREEARDHIDSMMLFPSIEVYNRAKWSKIYSGVFFIDTMDAEFFKPFTWRDDEYFEKTLYRIR